MGNSAVWESSPQGVGWYWVRGLSEKPQVVKVILNRNHEKFIYFFNKSGGPFPLRDYLRKTFWSPLEIPDVPAE